MSANCRSCPYPKGFLTQTKRPQSTFLTVRVSLGLYCYVNLFDEHNNEVEIHFDCIPTSFYSFSTNIYRGNIFVSFFQEHSQKVKALQHLPRKLQSDPEKQLNT